jgi:hypothetical protein
MRATRNKLYFVTVPIDIGFAEAVPRPCLRGPALCSFPDVSSAVNTAIAIIQMGIPVARMELMDRGLIEAVNAYSALDLPD